MRKYEHGSGWAFWRWTSVVKDGREYLRRLHLIKTPWFSVMLHWIKGADPDDVLHDHPVSFVSFVLRGSYVEKVPHQGHPGDCGWFTRTRTIHWLNVKRATDKHTIVCVPERGALTLVFAGPVVRSWGYWPRPWFFIPWQEFQR